MAYASGEQLSKSQLGQRGLVRLAFTASLALIMVFQYALSSQAVTPTSGPATGGTNVTVEGISFVSVHTGENFAVGLTSEGTLYSWGANQAGQLGNGTTSSSTTPQPVRGEGGIGILQGVTDVSVGFYQALAVTSGGVFAWGDNQFGQLGIGSTSNQPNPHPVKVLGPGGNGYLQGVTQVVSSGYFSMALLNGTVYAWGSNGLGQLGDNSFTDKNVPTQVVGVGGTGQLTGINQIDAGAGHSLASTGAALYSWGANGFGQLGVGTTSSSPAPQQVLGLNGNGFLSGIDQVSAGNTHTLALIEGHVYSWGWNVEGMLGTGTTTDSRVPTTVLNESGTAALAGIESIGTGSYNSYATISGRLYVWGSNSSGTLCLGSTANQIAFADLPVRVLAATGSSPLENVLSYSAANRVTTVLTPSGIVSCGDNHNGQFGDGTVVDSTRLILGPHFQQVGLMFGQSSAIDIQISGGRYTAKTPVGAVGVVDVTGSARVFGGAIPANPDAVTWKAGTFTYVEPVASGSSSSATSVSGSTAPVLAATGLGFLGESLVAALLLLLAGISMVTARKKS